MAVKQISVFVENKSGGLADITKALSDANVNIRALSLSEATDFGVLRLIVDRKNNTDTFDINVEMSQEMFSDNLAEVTAKEKQLVASLKAMLGIQAKVHLVAPKSITRSEGKAVRVIDKRKLYD